MAIVWKISSMDRDLTQGDNENIITQIHWTASDSDADVTEADAIGWAKDALGDEQVTAIEASIASQIDAQANPITASGLPF